MKRKGLFRAMGNIDEKYIKSAESHFTESKGKRAASTVFKVLGYAASFALIIGFAVFMWITAQKYKDPQITPGESGYLTTVTEPATDKEPDITTDAVTDPVTDPATDPITDPVTDPPETQSVPEESKAEQIKKAIEEYLAQNKNGVTAKETVIGDSVITAFDEPFESFSGEFRGRFIKAASKIVTGGVTKYFAFISDGGEGAYFQMEWTETVGGYIFKYNDGQKLTVISGDDIRYGLDEAYGAGIGDNDMIAACRCFKSDAYAKIEKLPVYVNGNSTGIYAEKIQDMYMIPFVSLMDKICGVTSRGDGVYGFVYNDTEYCINVKSMEAGVDKGANLLLIAPGDDYSGRIADPMRAEGDQELYVERKILFSTFFKFSGIDAKFVYKNDKLEITVTPKETKPPVVLVGSITVNAPQTSLKVGETMKLTATVSPDDAANKDVIWSIASGSSYAKISSDGTLTAKAAGVCTVRAKAADGSGVTANIKITIEDPVPEVFEEVVYLPVEAPQRTLTADETERLYRIYVNIMRNYSHITPGERFQIWVAGVEPDIKLSVNDVNLEIISGSQYAELDQRGVFAAKAEGEVKIRATLKANPAIKAERTVTITHPKKIDTWRGSGTFRDPYLIESVEDFEKIRTVCGVDSNECYWFRQTKDLDFSGISWVPFGAFFTHNYDGGGHKITNVTVDQNVSREPSLFGYVKMSVIKDLTIENFTNVNIAYRCFDGGVLFGAGIGSSVFNCHVKNATVDLRGNEASTVGGFVGTTVEPCIFVGCTTNAVCKAVSEVGGFIGTVQMDEMASVFYNCKATGTSESTGDPARCGGFFGKGEGYSESILDWLLKVHYVKGCTSTQRDKVLEAANG